MITLHYVGLDVHKETNEVVAFRENETVPCIEKRIPNHPKSIKKVFGKLPRKSPERIKTARRDDVVLATYLRNGDIEAIHMPTIYNEVMRDYLRSRVNMRLGLVRTTQRLQKFLLRHGYVYESNRYWTGRHYKMVARFKVFNTSDKRDI